MEPPRAEPPQDPEQWTDEEWIAYLEATDATTEDDDRPVTPIGRVTHSPGGQVLGQAMLGMASALFGRNDDEVVVVVEAGSEPGDDGPFTVHLDPDHPERSSVVVRPPSRPSE